MPACNKSAMKRSSRRAWSRRNNTISSNRSAQAADAAVAADKAAVENAKVQLIYCSIYSPINGRTGNLIVHQGNMIKANDVPALVNINQVEPIYVSFTVPAAISGGSEAVRARRQFAGRSGDPGRDRE